MSIRSIRERHGMSLENLAFFLDLDPEELRAAEARNEFFWAGNRERFLREIFPDASFRELHDDIFGLPLEEAMKASEEKIANAPMKDSLLHVVQMFSHSFWADEPTCDLCYLQPLREAEDTVGCHRFCMYASRS